MATRFLISLTLVSAILHATPGQAQSAGGEKDALLQEVRLLRQAIETLVGTNARVQIVFGRLQLQEQRTATTAKRLEDVRGALSKVVMQIAQMTESLQRYEELDLSTLEPKRREQIPMEIRSLKSELQLLETERQRLATQEADAANQLALEQNTWNDLNRSLDELERSLTQPRKQ
jgi:chromosome segregation ATPase